MRKRKIVRAIIYLCSALLLAGVLSSCSSNQKNSSSSSGDASSSNRKVNLRFSWWGGDDRNQATLDAIKKYTDKYPNVSISGEYTGDMGGYRDKLATQIASGSAPDLIQVDVTWLPGYAQKGDIFADMTKYKDIIDTSSFDQNFINQFSMFDNKLLGLPLGINAVTFMYNSELLKSAGVNITDNWDWDTFITEGKKVHQANSSEYFLNINSQGLFENVWSNYVRQLTGEKLVSDDYVIGFNKQQASQGFALIKRFYDENIVQPAEEATVYDKQIQQNPKWVAQQFGGALNYGSNLTLFKSGLGAAPATANIPVVQGAKNTSIIVRPQSFIVINNKSPEKEESAKFINFLLNDKDSQLALKDTRSVPPTETARTALEEAKLIDPLSVAIVNQALPKQGLADNNLSTNQQLNDAAVSIIQEIQFGKATPDQAADQLLSQWKDILRELKDNQQ